MPPSSKKLARQRFPVRSTGDFLMATDNRRALERELAHPPVRTAILDLPWGAGAGFVRTGAQQPGIVFCARIADHPKPWFRYVPLTRLCNRRPTRPGRPSSSTTRSPASPTPTRAAPAPPACSTAAPHRAALAPARGLPLPDPVTAAPGPATDPRFPGVPGTGPTVPSRSATSLRCTARAPTRRYVRQRRLGAWPAVASRLVVLSRRRSGT